MTFMKKDYEKHILQEENTERPDFSSTDMCYHFWNLQNYISSWPKTKTSVKKNCVSSRATAIFIEMQSSQSLKEIK